MLLLLHVFVRLVSVNSLHDQDALLHEVIAKCLLFPSLDAYHFLLKLVVDVLVAF
jgi:hypothetical protein